MNAEQSLLVRSAMLYDEIAEQMDDRTLEVLERRRQATTVRRRGWLVRRMLLGADLVGLVVAFVVAQLVVGPPLDPDAVNYEIEWIIFFGTLPLWVLVAKIYGLYDHDEERTDHSTVDEIVGIFHLVTLGAWLTMAATWITPWAKPDLTKLILFWAFAVAAVSLARASARSLARRRLAYLQNAVIVGAGDVGQLIGRKLLQHPEYGINLVGFVDAEPKERRDDLQHLTLLGSPEHLPEIVQAFDVERVLIAFSNASHEELLELIRALKDLDVQIDLVPRLFDVITPSVGIHTVEGLPLLGLRPLRLSNSSRLLKRSLDLAGSIAALVALAPFFALTALAIKLDSSGPVFFRQVRMGAGDRTFRIYKFRTMCIDAEQRKPEIAHLNRYTSRGSDPRMFKAIDDPRVTRVGSFLRRYSLDEFPQLLNVVRGEMSLVGPRPLILDEDQHVQAWARHRLYLRPGITGLWQVLGRNDIPFEEMTKLDYLYVTNWSPYNDLKLIARTVPAILKPRDAY